MTDWRRDDDDDEEETSAATTSIDQSTRMTSRGDTTKCWTDDAVLPPWLLNCPRRCPARRLLLLLLENCSQREGSARDFYHLCVVRCASTPSAATKETTESAVWESLEASLFLGVGTKNFWITWFGGDLQARGRQVSTGS